MADQVIPSRKWWVRRRGSIGATVVVVALLAGGAAAWAADGSGNSGYRMAKVVRASVSNSLTVVGSLAPVSDASAAFQVAGKVATVTAAVGQTVTAGESLATLDPTALSESVSSAQSALASDQAKLTEDEDSETASASSTTTTTTTTPTRTSTSTSTTVPTGSTGATGSTSQITADQQQLTSDQATTNADQQQEAVDLAQAQTDCGTTSGSTTTTTTTTTAPPTTACTSDLEQVSNDQQKVSADQTTVSHDESTLAKALASSSGSSGSGTNTGGAPSGASTASTTTTTTPKAASSSTSRSDTGTSGGGTEGASAASDTPEQIATDQAAIDSAQATLIDAQQSLAAAQLTSPINGTIVSVGISAGDTVSANSSTEVIVIIGTQSYEVSATLTSAEVQDVKVGDRAQVAVDGVDAPITGTVSQVGPVQYNDEAYSYPVVAVLPSSAQGLFSGSTANLTIATGGVDNVVAVPTSAVITNNATSYVEMLDKGVLTRKVVKLGMIGSVYSQVRSGLTVGQSVVLADYAAAVPSSNTATLGGGFGGGGLGGGGGGFSRITRNVGGASVSPVGGFGG